MKCGFIYIWEFIAAAGHICEFESMYGPEGEWAALFKLHPGYIGTELLRDGGNPRKFLTIDRWESKQAYEEFRTLYKMRFAELDALGEKLTEREARIGEFSPMDRESESSE